MINDSDTVSHYTWKENNTLLCTIYSEQTRKLRYVIYDLESGESEKLAPAVLRKDGHPTFICDKTTLLTDTYPNRFRYQSLITLDLNTNHKKKACFYRHRKFKGEVRTDLHPRVNKTESLVCIDDELNGFKAMKLVRLVGFNNETKEN